MELFMATLVESLLSLMFLALTIGLTYLIGYIKKKMSLEQRRLIEQIADVAILYVQKVMPNDLPDEKLREAVNAFVLVAKRYGITLDTEQIIIIIEARLKLMKIELGEAWKAD